MAEEEEHIGQELDRVVRAAMMAAGQVREHIARRMASGDQERRSALSEDRRQMETQSRLMLDRVKSREFWKNANGERVANAASYGAILSEHDPYARSVYEVVRDQAALRYGIDLDGLRQQYPGSEEDRRNALMHAVDDWNAANREDVNADADRALSEDLTVANDVSNEPATETKALDVVDASAETTALELGDEADRHDANATDLRDHAIGDQAFAAATPAANTSSDATPTERIEVITPRTQAGQTRQAVAASYPDSTRTALNTTTTKGAAKPKKARSNARGRQRDSGISR